MKPPDSQGNPRLPLLNEALKRHYGAKPAGNVTPDPHAHPGPGGVSGTPPIPGDWGPNTRWGPQGTPGPDPQWLTKFPWYQEPGHPGEPYRPLDPFWQHRKHVRPSAAGGGGNQNSSGATTPAQPSDTFAIPEGAGHVFGQAVGHLLANLAGTHLMNQANQEAQALHGQLKDQGMVE